MSGVVNLEGRRNEGGNLSIFLCNLPVHRCKALLAVSLLTFIACSSQAPFHTL